MAEPEFFPSGHIRYTCPLGCGWFFWTMTPPMNGLDEFLIRSRTVVSDHYRKNHGVEDVGA